MICDTDYPFPPTLVKYGPPELIVSKKKCSALCPVDSSKIPAFSQQGPEAEVTQSCLKVLSEWELSDVLNKILPPREWQTSKANAWRQKVSTSPATEQDLQDLNTKLDTWLVEREAHEQGYCPVRRDLYAQCFDEITRQTTILCRERGLLLHRIRKELDFSIDQYETLYLSATAYGLRRAMMNELEKLRIQNHIKDLEAEQTELAQEEVRLAAHIRTVKLQHKAVLSLLLNVGGARIEEQKKLHVELKKDVEANIGLGRRRKRPEESQEPKEDQPPPQ